MCTGAISALPAVGRCSVPSTSTLNRRCALAPVNALLIPPSDGIASMLARSCGVSVFHSASSTALRRAAISSAARVRWSAVGGTNAGTPTSGTSRSRDRPRSIASRVAAIGGSATSSATDNGCRSPARGADFNSSTPSFAVVAAREIWAAPSSAVARCAVSSISPAFAVMSDATVVSASRVRSSTSTVGARISMPRRMPTSSSARSTGAKFWYGSTGMAGLTSMDLPVPRS